MAQQPLTDEDLDAQLDMILYNLESEYLDAMERVWKGKDGPGSMVVANVDASARAKETIMHLFAEQLAARELAAYQNLHDCRIKVAEKHVGMQMIPDIYATNNLDRIKRLSAPQGEAKG